MRYGIIPTSLAERLALWLGREPAPILDSLLPLLQTRSLMAAVRLGIIDAIGANRVSAADVAHSRGLDADAVDMLLRVLVSAGYVSVAGGSRTTLYRLSSLGRRTLLRGSPMEARGYVLWNFVQWDLIEGLEDLLRTGQGLDLHQTLRGEETWQSYQDAMWDVSRHAAPILADLAPVPPGARQLLDIGGSHGQLGAAICRKHPPMRSIVLELPSALDHARAAARRAGIDGIVEHRPGNVLETDLPNDLDVILIANVIHHFTKADAARVLQKARAALRAGGTIAIWDFDRPSPGARPELAADASALYFRLTSTSQVVPGDEYLAWLREAGFGGLHLKRSLAAPFQVLASGSK